MSKIGFDNFKKDKKKDTGIKPLKSNGMIDNLIKENSELKKEIRRVRNDLFILNEKLKEKVEMPESIKISWKRISKSIESVWSPTKWSSIHDHYQIVKGWVEGLK